ncbi:MAG: hypothetical protein IPH71_12520 [Proteobacteria bacterium]|nr:hypothetical protein [Pseudomonadota bacterium]
MAEFELAVTRAGGTPTQVSCETRIAAGDHEKAPVGAATKTSLTLPGYPRIDCTFGGALTGVLATQAAAVTLFETGHADLAGTQWQIRSVGKVVRLGYELLLGGSVVATVETASMGRVWLQPTLEVARQQKRLSWLARCSIPLQRWSCRIPGYFGLLLWSERSDRTSARPALGHGSSARRSCRSRCGTCRSGCSRSALPSSSSCQLTMAITTMSPSAVIEMTGKSSSGFSSRAGRVCFMCFTSASRPLTTFGCAGCSPA